jgi:hypothetical protein
MLYMVQNGSKIFMDYAGNKMKRNYSMVKYMIYNMGRVNKVCIKKNYKVHQFLQSHLYYITAY